jgi:hypothetical protein
MVVAKSSARRSKTFLATSDAAVTVTGSMLFASHRCPTPCFGAWRVSYEL